MSFDYSDFKTGKSYKVEGPGLTEAQARQIFESQLKAGSLVGLKPGMVLDAAQQAVGGLAGAAAQAAQGLQQAAGSVLSTAGSAVKNLTSKALSGVPTNGINVADFAKQAPALGNIAQLGKTAVTSAVSQASKLVGQASDVMSDALGAGKFGLDATQLERAGLVKPGTAATYLAQGQNALTDVLKSPSVWTGQGGINSVNDLLSSVPTQDRVQQQLMQAGTSALGELGIPVDKLNPQVLAGAALNAAKSVTDAFAWATGGNLPTDVASAFNNVAKDGAFAVGFGETKVSDAMKQETPPEESIDTVDRATVNAAATRVVGSEKVPPVEYATPITPTSGNALIEEYNATKARRERAGAARRQKIAEANSQFASDINYMVAVQAGVELVLSADTEILAKFKDIKQRIKALSAPPISESTLDADINLSEIDIGLDELLLDKVKSIIESLRAQAGG